SALEVMTVHLGRIERVNPSVNAIVTLDAERALAGAREADAAQARGEPLGPLHGLPVAHKDTFLTRGMRTTFGSRLYRQFVPAEDSIVVERQRRAGALAVGKTNTPEFGAGSQTYNDVFGPTRNPYDLSKTCGGSSGGAAVALACGLVALADGSDLGGSLRNPASFCNVVGLRPSLGRVPQWPVQDAWNTLAVAGPMARTVEDVALLLSVLAGPDERDPLALSADGEPFRRSLEYDFRGTRVAWSSDLEGLPVDPAVSAVLEAHRGAFVELGCELEAAAPNLSGADEVFGTLRGVLFASTLGDLVDEHRELFKDTIVWNVEYGRSRSGADVAAAVKQHTQIFERMRRFMQRYDFLVAPVSQVPPFPIDQPYVTEINGVAMATYLDWMRSCTRITVTGHPALSVPCGFTPDGLPVGIQIVGRLRGELELLQLASAFERIACAGHRHPNL
ncbi:MAG: amidase, partial [Vulcanimicrobiaceae bacterium]